MKLVLFLLLLLSDAVHFREDNVQAACGILEVCLSFCNAWNSVMSRILRLKRS